MPDTPLYLQAHFREQVKDAFEVAIQQDVSKFSDAGIVDSEWTADQVVFRTGAPVNFVETTGQRGGVTQTGEYQAGFRSGFVRDCECGITFDRNDSRKLATANLPTSEVQADMRRAWRRKMDDVFIDVSMAQARGGPKPSHYVAAWLVHRQASADLRQCGIAATSPLGGGEKFEPLRGVGEIG